MSAKLIVALDFSNQTDAFNLIKHLDPNQCALKVGSELFTLLGTEFVRTLVDDGYKVFLDLKFHDIPNTVAKACHSAAQLGVWMINVHASGGCKMMRAAKAAVDEYGVQRPLLIAVTVLTSMRSADLPALGLTASVEQQVSLLAQLTAEAGLDGVVCSAIEVPRVKELCGSHFLTITPGIRLLGDNPDDQSRIMTPLQAVKLGSDYLVVGRSITRVPNPGKVITSILESLPYSLS